MELRIEASNNYNTFEHEHVNSGVHLRPSQLRVRKLVTLTQILETTDPSDEHSFIQVRLTKSPDST